MDKNNKFLPKKINTKHTGLLVFAIIVILGSATTAAQIKSDTANQNLGDQFYFENLKNREIKDGSYSAIGNYTSPGGIEEITVELQIKNGQVEDANVIPGAQISTSKIFQQEFVDNYKQFVIGKPISEIKLDKVAGSSLTPKGFNDALMKILNEAQS